MHQHKSCDQSVYRATYVADKILAVVIVNYMHTSLCTLFSALLHQSTTANAYESREREWSGPLTPPIAALAEDSTYYARPIVPTRLVLAVVDVCLTPRPCVSSHTAAHIACTLTLQ